MRETNDEPTSVRPESPIALRESIRKRDLKTEKGKAQTAAPAHEDLLSLRSDAQGWTLGKVIDVLI
ncbi:MAG: hypothetical protein AB7P69_10865 [Candidatus Binatia bacterium]